MPSRSTRTAAENVLVLTEIAQDGSKDLVDTAVGAPANLFRRDVREPAFDEC